MTTSTARSVVHDQFVLERTYPAAPERVFAAWASLEFKKQWFGGGEEFEPGGVHTLDFRVGGAEHLAGTVKGGGPSVTMDALYQDIVDGERIVWTYDMHMNGARISVSLASVEISGTPGGATLVYTEHGAYLDGLDTNEQRRGGTEELLDKLGTTFSS